MTRIYFRLSLMREAQPLTLESKAYQGLAIDAYILELYANAVGTFVAKTGKPYFVDPSLYRLTSEFFPDFKDKRWTDNLLEKFGLRDYISQNEDGLTVDALTASQAEDGGPAGISVETLVQAVMDYQRNRIPGIGAGAAIWDALEEGQGSLLSSSDFRAPEFLIAPYFFIDNLTSLEVNRRLAAVAVKERGANERVFGEIAIGKDRLISDVEKKRLIDTYGELELDGLLLWIAEFREWEEDPDYLEAFARFVSELKANKPKRAIYNLFGSFFSTVIAARGLLDASVQGVGISEYRAFLPGGGGITRYYIPVSHQSVGTDIADDLLQVRPDLISCSCGECSPKLPPSKMSVASLARHFISCRAAEYDHAKTVPIGTVVQELDEGKKRLEQVVSQNAGLFRAHGRRLGVWSTVIGKLEKAGVIH